MRIYPAIDLYEGKVVRLKRGDYREETVYSDQPDSVAKDWEAQGAEWIHVVDLEGAKTGVLKNLSVLEKIRKAVRCKIQFGGGLRTIEAIENILRLGVARAIIGSKVLDQPFFKKVINRFGGKIAVSLDARDGMIQTEGWLKTGQQTLDAALGVLNEYPLETIIYTDIQKDGMLAGPNFTELAEVLALTHANVILSGGVGSLGDIDGCNSRREKNFDGVIVGKALYEKKFTLKEAIDFLTQKKG